MPLDQLLIALEREATRAAELLLATARAEAEQLTIDSERELAQRHDTAVTAAAREQHTAVQRTITEAAHTARRDILLAREDLLTRIFGAMERAFPEALNLPTYRASLPSRLAAAAECLDDREPAVVHCSPALVPEFQAVTTAYQHMTVQPISDGASGFRLATADGTIEVDDTLETRLSVARPALARVALQLLEQPA